jgi:predicted nucleotidyltransferase
MFIIYILDFYGDEHMEVTLLTIEHIKEVLENIARQYGVKRVFLFGSYAKSTATSESDLDLIIEKGKPLSLLDLSGMKIQIEEQLKISVDLLTTDGVDYEISKDILETEVLIYER